MTEKKTIIFFGSGDFPVKTLTHLINDGTYEVKAVVTTNYKSEFGEEHIAKVAYENKIPCYVQGKDGDMEKLARWLTGNELTADIACVISYKFLPKCVTDLFTVSFNVHASLLPFLRGSAPIHWAIRKGFDKTGLTSFILSDKIDAGNVICAVETEVNQEETFGTLFDRLSVMSPEFTMETLEKIVSRWPVVMTSTQTTGMVPKDLLRAPKLSSENTDFDNDDVKTSEELYRSIRACSPNYGYTMHFETYPDGKDLTIKVYEASLYPASDTWKTVNTDGKSHISVTLSSDDKMSVLLKVVQLPCRKKMGIWDFLAGCHDLHKGKNILKLKKGNKIWQTDE